MERPGLLTAEAASGAPRTTCMHISHVCTCYAHAGSRRTRSSRRRPDATRASCLRSSAPPRRAPCQTRTHMHTRTCTCTCTCTHTRALAHVSTCPRACACKQRRHLSDDDCRSRLPVEVHQRCQKDMERTPDDLVRPAPPSGRTCAAATCVHTCMRTHVHACTCTHMHTCTRTRAWAYARVCAGVLVVSCS